MVGFGKQIRKAKRDEWDAAYLDYDRLKIIVKDVQRTLLTGDDPNEQLSEESAPLTFTNGDLSRSENLDALRDRFFRELALEVEKISLFTLQQQGKLADAVGVLRFESTNIFQQLNSSLLGTAAIYNNKLYRHLAIGTEFLHLLRFICLNSIGVRKILKKYNKLFEKKDEAHWYTIEGNHLQQLSLSRSMSAIQTSLELEFQRLYFELHQYPANEHIVVQVIRFRNIIDCVHSIQRYTEILQRPFWNFLSQSSMIGTTVNFGGLDRASNDAMKWLLRLEPESIMNMDEVQLKSLGYMWPATTSSMQSEGEIPDLKRQALATIREETSGSIISSIEGAPSFTEEEFEPRLFWGGVDKTSMALNLLSKLLYTVNYYIVAPTANRYAIGLGLNGAFGATLIGASSVSAFFAAFIFSFWYTRSTFKSALIFSAMCPVFGNLLYAMAISCHSMEMAVLGRILVGFGSAEVVNRQLISACVSFDTMTRASVLFVISDAAGMSIGPMLAAILDTFSGRDLNVDLSLPFLPAGGLIYDHITSPGFVMSGIWFLELVALIVFFREPARLNDEEDSGGIASSHSDYSHTTDEGDSHAISKAKGYGSFPSQDSSVAQSERGSTIQLIFKNPGLPLTVLLFGYVEMTCEVLISSCSMIVRRYFGWHGNRAGLLLACLGSLVLPAHFVVEKASHYYSERKILFFSLLFVLLCFFGIFNWTAIFYDIVGSITVSESGMTNSSMITETKIGREHISDLLTPKGEFTYEFGAGPYVYVSFLSAIFLGTIVMEGVNTSIMAKITPAKLNRCFLNAGLLATLVGTLGRVFADVIITSSALLDQHIFVDFVTVTFLPLMLLAIVGLVTVRWLYDHLMTS